MKVLVTRPAEDGAEIAQRLAAMGHEALLAPLLRVEFHGGPPLVLDDVQAILATSANGVRAVARRTARRDLPLFAVGPQTAAAAEAAGFIRVRNAAGDAAALVVRAAEWADPAKGWLLHAAGEEASGALAETLRTLGFQVRRESLYRVIPVQEMPPEAASALAQGKVDAALFFSPRSAETFAACMAQARLDTRSVVAVCISENTATALGDMEFREIRVAPAPNQDSLLAAL
jgi:uroporphyrinogen-III synthase